MTYLFLSADYLALFFTPSFPFNHVLIRGAYSEYRFSLLDRSKPWSWTLTCTGSGRARCSSGPECWPTWRRSGTSRSPTSSSTSRPGAVVTWPASKTPQPRLNFRRCTRKGGAWLTPSPFPPQGLRQAAAAADGHEGDPEELRRLPEAQELAVVEAVHQGQETGPIMHHMESVPPLASNPCCTGLSPPLIL